MTDRRNMTKDLESRVLCSGGDVRHFQILDEDATGDNLRLSGTLSFSYLTA